MRAAIALAILVAASPALAVEVVLQNDGFTGMGELTSPGNFVAKEGVGETFILPPGKSTILGVQFMAVGEGGANGGEDNPTIIAYVDNGASAAPGMQLVMTKLGTDDMPIVGSTMFIQSADFSPQPTVDGGSVRVAFFFGKKTLGGGLTMLMDKSVSPAKHGTLCAEPSPGKPCEWIYSSAAGVKGTWLLRLVIDSDATATDMGRPRPDGGVIVPPGGAPVVDSILPTTFPEGMGGPALIRGGGFIAGASRSSVTFDSPERGPVSIGNALIEDDRTIKIQIPEALKEGSYDVIVQNPDGKSGKLSRGLTITARDGTKAGCSTGGPRVVDLGALLLMLLVLPLFLRRAFARQRA